MYSKVVYDYFNSSPKKFQFKPNKLTRANAFKRKAIKTVTVPKNSNTSTNILKNFAPVEESTKASISSTENKSKINVVYDTVQYIWRYAKSFLSNQNSDLSSTQERLRNKIKRKSSSRSSNSKYLRSISCETFSNNVFEENEEICDQANVINEKLSTENFLSETKLEIMENEIKNDQKIEEDVSIEKIENSINLQEFQVQSITEINIKKLSNCDEADLCLLDVNDKKSNSTNSDNDTKKETENNKSVNENISRKLSNKKMQPQNTLTEIYIKQQELQQDNQNKAENFNVVEVQILKSSLKTYGRGKRKNKKLHVHFKDDHDNEKSKYSTYKSKNLRKSDCYHPNAFYKKINKNTAEKNKSVHNIRGKKRRLALCTKSSRSSFKKKRAKHSSSSNCSIQSKSSDYCEHKCSRKSYKKSKKYSVHTAKKVCKKNRTRNCKKTTINEKNVKALQENAKTTTDTNFEEPVNISQNNTTEVMKTFNVDVDIGNSQHSNIYLQQITTTTTTENDDLNEKNQDIFEPNNEFIEFQNNEQLNITSFEDISKNDENM